MVGVEGVSLRDWAAGIELAPLLPLALPVAGMVAGR
jgi:hypothetical protein